MRKIVGHLVVIILVGTAAYADDSDELTGWQKTKLVAVYPLAIHQLPVTTIHEGTHALVSRLFGDRPKLHLLPSYIESSNGKSLSLAYIEHTKQLSPVAECIESIAPYLLQVLVIDRTSEWAYQSGRIRIDSISDKYVQNMILFNLLSPLENAISKDTDFGKLARHTRVPRFILAGVVQTAYIASYRRMMKARGHPNSTWEFYVHFTF